MSSVVTTTTTTATGATGRSGERMAQNAEAYRICAVRNAEVPAKKARSLWTTRKLSPMIENTIPNATSFSTMSTGGGPSTSSSDAVAIGLASASSQRRLVSEPMIASAPKTTTSAIPGAADDTAEKNDAG